MMEQKKYKTICPDCGEDYVGWINEVSMSTSCNKCLKARNILDDEHIKMVQKEWRKRRDKILK